MKLTPNVLFIIFGVLLIGAVLYFYRKSIEGFEGDVATVQSALDGMLPSASQTSMIPSDNAGSTSSDPTSAKPQARDVQATMESLNNLVLLATSKDPASTDMPIADKTNATAFKTQAPIYINQLQMALANPDASTYTVATLSALRSTIEATTNALRNSSVVSGPTRPASSMPYTRIGCYADKQTRAIPTNENTNNPLLAGDYHNRPDAIDACYKVALQKGDKVFAVQAGGWCASSPSDDPAVYGKYGVSNGCNSDGKGGHWANDVYKINPVQVSQPTPTTVANRPGVITLNELHSLNTRVQQEIVRLSNLRSTSPTLTNRLSHLEKLSADIGDIITSVERGTMDIEKVPITPDAATAFLKQLPNTGVALPALIVPHGETNKKMKATGAPYDLSSVNNPALQGLLKNAQYLKWNVQLNLEFNPELAQKGRLIERLEAMETRLTNLAISETPLPKEMYELYANEMKTIQAIMGVSNKGDRSPPIDLPSTQSTRLDIPFATADYPSSAQMSTAQGCGFGPSEGNFPNGEPTPDVYIRPGFKMTDSTIEHRASASAFDPSTVGGPDYKKRALELCKQVQEAQLGDPESFGCIANPDTVGPNYSWKGNYQMVCNRVGDTWGGWYPEMFGCPKYDPSAKFQGNMM